MEDQDSSGNGTIIGNGQSIRTNGYYWVSHDFMWFVAYYNSSEYVFYFPGQIIGFDPDELEVIDERKIERQS